MVTIYGIKNCDTVRKALKWLDGHHIEYRFHDFRKDGADGTQFAAWAEELGLEVLINKRGPSWRKIPEARRENLDISRAVELMLETPTIIKRPVLDLGGRRIVGFNETEYETIFS